MFVLPLGGAAFAKQVPLTETRPITQHRSHSVTQHPKTQAREDVQKKDAGSAGASTSEQTEPKTDLGALFGLVFIVGLGMAAYECFKPEGTKEERRRLHEANMAAREAEMKHPPH